MPKPARTFLEMDELVALIEAAEAQDSATTVVVPVGDSTRDRVARRAAAGRRPSDIAAELGLAKATVSFHLKNLDIDATPYVGRGVIVEMLGRSGVRVSELCDLQLGDVRSATTAPFPDHGRQDRRRRPRGRDDARPRRAFRASTFARIKAAGRPSGPDAYVFPNVRGGRMTRQRVGKIVREAAAAATDRLERHGLPPLPDHDAAHDAPHLHLDRAARQQLRREVGHEPGRTRRLEDDDSTSTPSSSSASSAPMGSPSTSSLRTRKRQPADAESGHVWDTRPRRARFEGEHRGGQ